jgi:hypothetical protein
MSNQKTPDQDLYDAIFAASVALGYSTYQHNPPETATYPFVRIGNVQLVPIATKSYLLADVYANIDVWGSAKSRKKVSEMAHKLIHAVSRIKQLPGGLLLSVNFDTSSVEVMTDNSTNDDLWRARVSLHLTLR